MKKYTFFFGLIWVLAICTSSLKAQEISTNIPSENILKENITFKNKKFYIGIQGGYNFVLAPITMQGISIGYRRQGDYQVIPLRLSLGRGGQVGLNFGYMFNKYIGIELGLSYLHSLPYKANYHESFSSDSVKEDGSSVFSDVFDYNRLLGANMGNASISVILTTDFKKWNPYLKFGLLVNGGQVRFKESIIGDRYEGDLYGGSPGNEYDEDGNKIGKFPIYRLYEENNEFLISTAIGLGFTATLGCTYNISPLISIFAEWQFSCIKSRVFRDECLKHEVNGVEQGDLYWNEWEASKTSSWHAVGGSLIFNNTGLQIGIKFHL